MDIKTIGAGIFLLFAVSLSSAQTAAAYETTDTSSTSTKSLLDPSRFQMHHMLSFGMASSNGMAAQSQSFYTNMLQYKFSDPVTLNLNFSMPLHSTFNQSQNLSQQNIQSFEYFRNMPFEAALTWKPSTNMMMRLCIVRDPQATLDSRYSPVYAPLGMDPFRGW